MTGLLRTLRAPRSGVAATVQTLLANMLILGLNVCTGIITARILGPSGRGEQAAMMMWPQLLAYTLTLGLPSALLYNLKRYPERASQLFSVALLLGTLMGLLATVAGALFIPYWLTEYSPEVVRFTQWVMLITPLSLLTLIFAAASQAREEFGVFNAVRYLPPVLTLFALALLILVYRLTPFNVVLSYVLAIVPIFLWMLIRLWRLYRPRWHGLRASFRNLTSYGLRSYGVDLLGTLFLHIDRVLVVGLLDPALMGLYVVAVSLARLVLIPHTAVVSILLPKASGRTVEEVVALVGRAARITTTAVLPAAVGLLLFGSWALGLLYGQEYLGTIIVFRLLVVEAVLGGISWVLVQAFMAVGRPGIATVEQVIGLGLSVLLLLLLVPRYGLEGAGLALLISTATRLVFVTVSFPFILKVRPPKLWATRADLDMILRWKGEAPKE